MRLRQADSRIDPSDARGEVAAVGVGPNVETDGTDAKAGEALDAAMAGDRAWREARSQAMQRRMNRAVRAEDLGHRMRTWAWWCVCGGGFPLILTIPASSLVDRYPEIRPMLAVVFGGLLAALLLGVVLLPVSKVLRVGAGLWQHRLLQLAARDYLEVREADLSD